MCYTFLKKFSKTFGQLHLEGANSLEFCRLFWNKDFFQKRHMVTHQKKCVSDRRFEEMHETIQNQKETIVKITAIMKERESHLCDTVSRYEKQIKNLTTIYENQIRDISSRLENVATKAATKSTNTNILKLENLTSEHLQNCAKLFKPEHISDVSSLAHFAASQIELLQQTSLEKQEDNKKVKDPKGKQLAYKFFSSIKNLKEISDTVQQQILSELGNVSDEERQTLFDQMTELIRIQKGTIKISQGEEHELKQEFINKLC